MPMRSEGEGGLTEKLGGEELEGAKVQWVEETGGLLVKSMRFGGFVQPPEYGR